MKAELIDGKLHVLGKVFNLYEDVDLTGMWITELPDNLCVNGNLILTGTWLTALPKELVVNLNIDIRGTSITTIPNDTKSGTRIIMDLSTARSIAPQLDTFVWSGLEHIISRKDIAGTACIRKRFSRPKKVSPYVSDNEESTKGNR